MPLFLHLLDDPHLEKNGARLEFPSSKSLSLLFYLALRGEWVSREELADLFRPESDEATARHYLRLLLAKTREFSFAETLEVTKQRLRWLVDSDVKAFREALGKNNLQKAVELYKRPLLSGLSATDLTAYEAWLELERASSHNAWRKAALELSKRQPPGEAMSLLRRLLDDHLLEEDIVQRFLLVSHEVGERQEALSVYEKFRDEVKRELDLEPLPETVQLAKRLRESKVSERRAIKPLERSLQTSLPKTLEQARLIGREGMIRRVQQTTEPVVLLAGEAGIGKTSLAKTVAPNTLYLRSPEGLDSVPYFSLVQHLRDNLSVLPDLGLYLDELARLVPEVRPGTLPPPFDPSLGKGRLLEAWSRYLKAFASHESFALIFDDVQWADAGTLELIVYLAQQHKRLLLCYRSNEVSEALQRTLDALASVSVTIAVEPLAQDAVTNLLANLIGTSEGPELFSKWLFERTGGNPFFALETIKGLFASGALREEDKAWHSHLDDITKDYSELDIPKAVAETINRRVRGLSEASQRVLPVAAVIGEDFSGEMLSELTGLSSFAVLDVLEEAERAGVIRELRFNHDLLRQSLYTSLSLARRKVLHGHIAAMLIQRPEADSSFIARHFELAGDMEQAVTYHLETVKRFVQGGLLYESCGVLERLLSLTPPREDRIIAELSNLYQLTANSKAATLAKAVQDSQDDQARVTALNTLAMIAFEGGQLQVALDYADQAQSLADSKSLESKSFDVACTRMIILHQLGRTEEALSLLEATIKDYKTFTPMDRLVLSINRATYYHDLGRIEEAVPLHQENVRAAKKLGAASLQVTAAYNLLSSLVALGRAEEGLAEAEEALKLPYADNWLRGSLARAYRDLTRYDEATALYLEVTRGENAALRANAWAGLVRTYHALGNLRKRHEALREAINALKNTDYPGIRARVFIVVLMYGDGEQKAAIEPLLKTLDLGLLTPDVRAELEPLLKTQ